MKHKDGSLILISLEVRTWGSSLSLSVRLTNKLFFTIQVNEFQYNGQLCFRGRITRMNKRQKKRYDHSTTGELIGAASIGLYQVERTVGSGSFGNVQLCTHKLTGEKVAIKTLKAKQYAVRVFAALITRGTLSVFCLSMLNALPHRS